MTARELIRLAIKDGGATVLNSEPVKYADGYQYAITDYRCTTIEEAAARVEQLGGSCGLWYDAATAEICIDVSRWIRSKAEAIKLGKFYGQKSIFDWKNGAAIELN